MFIQVIITLAPEIVKGEAYTKAVDWWSVGTLIFEMLAGFPPFFSSDTNDIYYGITRAPLDIPPEFSPYAADIVSKFIERDTKKRLQDIDRIQKHPWFKDINWPKLEKLEVPPPFVPSVNSSDDISNIDTAFLEEDVNYESDQEEVQGSSHKDQFIGFTYAPQDV